MHPLKETSTLRASVLCENLFARLAPVYQECKRRNCSFQDRFWLVAYKFSFSFDVHGSVSHECFLISFWELILSLMRWQVLHTANTSEKMKTYGVEIWISLHLGSRPMCTWKAECLVIKSLWAAAFIQELQSLPKIKIAFVSWSLCAVENSLLTSYVQGAWKVGLRWVSVRWKYCPQPLSLWEHKTHLSLSACRCFVSNYIFPYPQDQFSQIIYFLYLLPYLVKT